MLRYRTIESDGEHRYFLGYEFPDLKFEEIPDAAAFRLIDNLKNITKDGKFDSDLIVFQHRGRIFAYSETRDLKIKFALYTRYLGTGFRRQWPFFFDRLKVVCVVICGESAVKFQSTFYIRKGKCLETISGYVDLNDFYFALIDRIAAIERYRNAKLGEKIVNTAESIESDKRIIGGGGITKAEIREMIKKEDEEKRAQKDAAGFKYPHLDGTAE